MITDAPKGPPAMDPVIAQVAKLLQGRTREELLIIRGAVLAILYPPKRPAPPKWDRLN